MDFTGHNDNDWQGSGAWTPWYDKCHGFVIAATSEEQARIIADAAAGDENGFRNVKHPWLDPKQSTCVLMSEVDRTGVIIQDFRAA